MRREESGQVYDLTRLWSRNDPLEVRVFTALADPFLTFGGALEATLFLILLFLSTDTFSLALIHALSPPHVNRICNYVRSASRPDR